MAELLRMEGITKQFGAVYANKDINLSIEEGEIHTLLGENGAGKKYPDEYSHRAVSAYFRYDLVKRQKGKDRFTKNSGKTGGSEWCISILCWWMP